MAKNTDINIGIRRFITSLNGYRNFEPTGTTYTVIRATGYEYQGTHYNPGDVIPMDGPGGTSYTNLAQLERDFNSGFIDPTS
jgi:hypothetical protein